MKTKINFLSLLTIFLLCGCENNTEISSSNEQTSEPISSEVSSSTDISSSSESSISESSSSEEAKTYAFSVTNNKVSLTSDVKAQIETNRLCNEVASTEGTLTYKSLDTNIASVSSTGEISYVGFGRCKVEVSWEVASNTYKDYVTVDCYNEVSLENLNTFADDYITTQGRTYTGTSGLVLSNTATGIDFGFKGKELKIKAKGTSNKAYIHVYIDDDTEGTLIKINSTSEKEYTICENLSEGFHKVRIIKATSTQYGTIFLKGFTSEVTYYKAPKKDLTIEFLGDSISCGYGNLGSAAVSASSANQDAGQAFPYLTARELDANFSVIALEGICAKDGSPNIYNCYDSYTVTVNKNPYDCSSYDPDIIVIGLGENDMWHATDSQFDYTVEQFRTDYKDLILLVRSYHPNAHIICMYGMMNASSTTQALQTIEGAITDSADTNISSLKVTMNQSGSETHPNVKGHKNFTKKLVAKINEYLNK